MTDGIIFLLCLVSLLAFFGIMVGAIYAATQREKKYVKIQAVILAMMAKKQGIDDEEIRRVFRTERVPVPF